MIENGKKKLVDKPFSPNVNRWLEVKIDIEMKIIQDEYQTGQKLPSIVGLSKMYGIGNTTSHKILNALSDEGICLKKRGGDKSGYFVNPHVKEKLLITHENELRLKISEAVKYAKSLRIDDNELLQKFKEAWAMVNEN